VPLGCPGLLNTTAILALEVPFNVAEGLKAAVSKTILICLDMSSYDNLSGLVLICLDLS